MRREELKKKKSEKTRLYRLNRIAIISDRDSARSILFLKQCVTYPRHKLARSLACSSTRSRVSLNLSRQSSDFDVSYVYVCMRKRVASSNQDDLSWRLAFLKLHLDNGYFHIQSALFAGACAIVPNTKSQYIFCVR